MFRSNPFSFSNNKAESKFLHTLSLSYLPETCLTLVNKNSSGIFTNVIQESSSSPSTSSSPNSSGAGSYPEDHLHKGATSGFNDPFDIVVNSKLQSLWLTRQNIKGDGGQIYELENGSLIIRTSNVFLHGMFKGLLIQIEAQEYKVDEIEKILQKYNIPKGNLCKDVLDSKNLDQYGDLSLQYAEILNF